jgi:nucleoside-diphosphate-sugar epimerase
MITGGLGFIGSNLARRLVSAGADVLIVDALIPDYGGNAFNIEGIEDAVRVNYADVRNERVMEVLVRDREVIFNLAGQVSHIDSMRDPHTDLEINCRAQLSMLEACRKYNPATKVVFAGTRQVYGRPDYLPVDERHLVRPVDINGVNKAAGEYYHLLYNNVFGVRACSLRLTNVILVRADASQVFGTTSDGAVVVSPVYLAPNGNADGFLNVASNGVEQCFVIQATTDFQSWVNVQTNSTDTGLLQFADAQAGELVRRHTKVVLQRDSPHPHIGPKDAKLRKAPR